MGLLAKFRWLIFFINHPIAEKPSRTKGQSQNFAHTKADPRDLIIHGPAHRGANGAVMPTDEGDQDGQFFFNHPEMGGYPAA